MVNLIADNLRSKRDSYILDVWAAVLKLMENDDLRVRIYTTYADESQGIVQVFGGTHPLDGTQDETSRYSWMSSKSLGVGQDQSGTYTGRIYAMQLYASRVDTDEIRTRDGSKIILRVDNGKRIGRFDQLSIGGSAELDVHWVYSNTLGGYVLSTSTSLK